MHSPFLLDAAAFHLAERWFRKQRPRATPADAERWAAGHQSPSADVPTQDQAQLFGDSVRAMSEHRCRYQR